MRIEVLNNSRLPWIEFEFELQEQLGKASQFGDGLSFDQRRVDSGNIWSESFGKHSRAFEPYDRLLFREGKVDYLDCGFLQLPDHRLHAALGVLSGAGSAHPVVVTLQMPCRRPNVRAMDLSSEKELRELLAFYAEAGVDAALSEEPSNRFAADEMRAAPRPGKLTGRGPLRRLPGQNQAPVFTAPRMAVAVPDEGQVALARKRAEKAATLDELRQHMADFEGCNLKFTAKKPGFRRWKSGRRRDDRRRGAGRDEDLEGLPFVGRSGQLLDRMLAAIGLDRQSVYIANVIPWRPPGNRTPTPQETEICRPFIERQVELVGPKILVTLGGPSAKTLLNATEGVLRLRGTWKAHVTASGTSIPAMPTLHPAYLLRNPAHKKLAWRDFLEIKAKLRTLGGS